MKYSVIVPAHNEVDSVEPLFAAVQVVMDELVGESAVIDSNSNDSHAKNTADTWEMIVVDDGSRDGTLAALQAVRARDDRLKIIAFRRQFGQTAAWSAGFHHAQGEIVIVLDADLQNDPKDIPGMIRTLDEKDLDVVSGWRQKRKDQPLLMLGSKMGNMLRRWITGERIHDHGCSLKVYRREALADLELYGEMHRYITALLTWKGFRVGEMKVRHHARKHGKTKYSIRKKLKGLLDLVVVKFWIQYAARPMHFFGAIGAVFIGVGLALGGTLGVLWLLRIIGLNGRSTPLLAVLLVLLGFQFLLTGVLADVVAKTYYAQKRSYTIKFVEGVIDEE